MPPVGFEPTISASERPQTYALDRAATGTGNHTISDTSKIGIGSVAFGVACDWNTHLIQTDGGRASFLKKIKIPALILAVISGKRLKAFQEGIL